MDANQCALLMHHFLSCPSYDSYLTGFSENAEIYGEGKLFCSAPLRDFQLSSRRPKLCLPFHKQRCPTVFSCSTRKFCTALTGFFVKAFPSAPFAVCGDKRLWTQRTMQWHYRFIAGPLCTGQALILSYPYIRKLCTMEQSFLALNNRKIERKFIASWTRSHCMWPTRNCCLYKSDS